MRRVRAAATVAGTPEEVRALWFDPARRPVFVDGFASVVRVDPEWPVRGELVWNTRQGGRGRVVERADGGFEDPLVRGFQRVTFEPEGDDGTRVRAEVAFALKERSAVAPLRELVVVRSALRDGLRRTLRRFAVECAEQAELKRPPV